MLNIDSLKSRLKFKVDTSIEALVKKYSTSEYLIDDIPSIDATVVVEDAIRFVSEHEGKEG